jgi:hypothetical protein
MSTITKIFASALTILNISGCAPGFLNTGGTNDPRELIGVAYTRMKSNRVVGARNVLRRSIEQSKKQHDQYALAVSYNMMGFTYIVEEKDPSKALDFYSNAFELIKSNNYECELIHNYIGVSLTNDLLGIPENVCSYRDKALKALELAKQNFREGQRKCEGGWRAVTIAEERIEKLNSKIKCNY